MKNQRVVLGELQFDQKKNRLDSNGSVITDNSYRVNKPAGIDHTFLKNGSELTIGLILDQNIEQHDQNNPMTPLLSRSSSKFAIVEELDELKNTLTSKSSLMLSNLKLTKINDKNTQEQRKSPRGVLSSVLTPQKQHSNLAEYNEELPPKSSRRTGKSVSRTQNKSPFKSEVRLSELVKKGNIPETSEYQVMDLHTKSSDTLMYGVHSSQEYRKFNFQDSTNEKNLNKTETLKRLFPCTNTLKSSKTTPNLFDLDDDNLVNDRLLDQDQEERQKKEYDLAYNQDLLNVCGYEFASSDPTYKAICYKEYHSIELRFRQILEERDERFSAILESKDRRIDDLSIENLRLLKKIEDIKSQLFC